jgi:hypothetical protein
LTTHDTRYYQEADQIIHLAGGKIEEFKTGLSLAEFDLLQRNRVPDGKKAGVQDVWCFSNEEEGMETLKLEKEERETGRVAFKVYKEYFLYGVSAILLFIVFLVFYSGQGKKLANSLIRSLRRQSKVAYRVVFYFFSTCNWTHWCF